MIMFKDQSMTVSMQSLSKASLISLNIGPFFFQHVKILASSHLRFQLGEWIGIIGRSGVGKTTLLRCLAGLEYDITPLSHPFKIGYMPQKDWLLPWKTIYENIALPCLLQNKPVDRSLIEHYLSLTGLEHYQNNYPQQLSHGMRQRVALARALFAEGDLILMDEPFAALDALTKQEMYQFTKTILYNKTVIFVTHDAHEVCQLADRFYVLQGRPASLMPLQASSPQQLVESLSAC